VVLTGAIADSGSAIGIDANGVVDAQNNTETELSLVHGSFRVNTVALDKKLNSAFNSFQPSATTCSGYVSASAPSPVVSGSGTGAYQGISGSVTLTSPSPLFSPSTRAESTRANATRATIRRRSVRQ